MITISHLSLTYTLSDETPLTALDDISLTVGEGEYVAIMGPNGSGKTTLARCLNGLLRPTSGHILIDGLNPADPDTVWEVRRRVGMVFQNPDDQIISATVEREIAFGLENLGLPSSRIRERVDATLRRFDLAAYRDHPPHRLSGGEKQRLAIASVMAMEPKYLVLDEPTSLLDPRSRQDLAGLLRQIHPEGETTILHITQFPEEALDADRLVILAEGQIVSDGNPLSLLSKPTELRQWHLEAPVLFRLNEALRTSHISLPQEILTEVAPAPETKAQHPLSSTRSFQHDSGTGNALAADHLTHVYDKGLPTQQTALRDVCVRIRRGECVALIGPTGSGKTTLAEHFIGLLKPFSGRVLVDGTDLWEAKKEVHEVRRKVGLVFQFPEFQFFEENVLKEVAFGPRNLRLEEAEIDTRVRDALGLVGLDPDLFGPRSPLLLSAGEQRLVAMASAIAMRPEILIVDEPTAGLDPEGVQRIFELVQRLHSVGVTLLLISHHTDLVAQVAERIIVLDGGSVMLEGTPREVFQQDDLLTSVGLDVPSVARIMRALRHRGWKVRSDVLTLQEAEEEICAHAPPRYSLRTE